MSDEKADSPDNSADNHAAPQALVPHGKHRMRLDLLLVEKQPGKPRKARRLIMAGEYSGVGAVADKAGQLVATDDVVGAVLCQPGRPAGGGARCLALEASCRG